MSKRFLCLILLFAIGCVSVEINITKIGEAANGTTVEVPKGDRLSIFVKGKWYTPVDVKVTDNLKYLGNDRCEKRINNRNTQVLGMHFAVYGSGKVWFRYHYNDVEQREFVVYVKQ